MAEFVTVARVGEIPEGAGKAFTVNDRLVAVFQVKGEYHAVNDCCPHMGASLADGEMHENTIVCPWHAWRFRVTDGAWCDNPRVKTEVYEVRVAGDEIQVSVPD